MSASGFTPISLYYSTTASAVPTAANLVPGELAINTNDGKLYYEDSAGVVQVLATKSTGSIGGSNTQVQFNNSGSLGGSSSFTWDGTTVTATKFAGALNGTVGATTASTGAFTTLTSNGATTFTAGTASTSTTTGTTVITGGLGVSGRINAANFDGIVGANTAATGSFTNLAYTGTLTGGTGIVNLGSGQFYKDASGNVGIGTSSPIRPLQVGAYGSGNGEIALAASTTGVGSILFGDGATGTDFYRGYIQYAHTNDAMLFATAAGERMRIDSSGNVGIGTTSPSAKLEISGATDTIKTYGSSFNQQIYDAVTGAFSQAVWSVNAVAQALVGCGGGNMLLNTGGNSTANMIFSTGSGTTERMRIESGGNLLVNTTTGYTGKLRVDNVSADGIGVQLTGSGGGAFIANIANTNQNFAYWVYSGSAVGSINTNGSTTSYNITSDYRLKENVVPMTDALAKVTQLKPVTYRWKESGLDGQGFIAHELQAVVPDCVTGEKDAIDADGKPVYQQMDTSHLVATLVSAIQELKAEFDAYKATHP